MTEERHSGTPRDYLRAFKRRRWVILGIALVAALAAAGLSLKQHKTYSATASLQALPLSATSGEADIPTYTQDIPATTAAQLMQTATRSEVLDRVRAQLGLHASDDTIRNDLSLAQDQQSNFVNLTATASTAAGAEQLANATATAVADESNTTIQNHFAAVAKEVQASSNALLRPFIGKKLSQLTASERAQYSTAYNEALTLQTDAGHLSTFAKVVTVAQVVSRAGLPSAPSGPHVATNVILGLVVGLLLGLLVTWFLESFDRRLRRPDETSELLGLPVLGAVPAGMLGKSPASGDKQPLSITAFRMLRTNVRFLAKNLEDAPRVVLVTSAIAEEGKTTVAMGLALAGASGGLNTLLIEADVHRPVHADRLGLNASPGLADYLTGGVPPEQILQVHPFVDAAAATPQNGASSNGRSSKLTCITAGDTGHFGGEALSSKRFAEMIAEVRQVYDLVVIDSAPLLAVPETSEMVTFVDAMVFCVRLGKTTTEHARAARAALDRLPTRLVGLVLTDLEADAGGYYGYAYGYGDAEREKSAADRVAS